jgi:hypothetical protein
MRQTTVFLNDYVEKRRTGLTFAEDDFIMVEARWESEEQQLVALQNIDVFAGLTRYSQLSTEHFRVLLQQALIHYAKLPEGDKADPSHPTTALAHFLILSLARCVEIKTGAVVELLRINRISPQDISFDFSAVMDMNFAKPPVVKSDDEPFKIVVDNTK